MVTPIPLRSILLQAGPGGPVGPDAVSGIDPVAGLVGSAIGSFLTTLLVGAIMIALAPEYTERRMATVRDDPVGCFVYGFLAILVLIVLTILLFVTIVGIIVAIPLALLAFIAGAVGAAIAYLTIGERLVGREDGWTKPLVVGAGIAGGLSLVPLGGLVAFAIGTAGFGAILKDYRKGDEGDASERIEQPDDSGGSGGRSGDPVADEIDR